MKSIINSFSILALLLMGALLTAAENKKLAQTGFQFLSVVSDARASAMAEAMTSLETGSSALFFNPDGNSGHHGERQSVDRRHPAQHVQSCAESRERGIRGIGFQPSDG